MPTTADYLNNLVAQKNALADNLVAKGVSATHDELLDTLVPKVLEISGGGDGGSNGIYPINEYGLPSGDVAVPEGVTTLGYNSSLRSAFYYNHFVTSVELPSTLQSIGASAFYECINLASVIFKVPSVITRLDSSAFSGCSSLTSITLPTSVERIEPYCFRSSGLININIPHSVTYIGNSAFSSCTALETISLPDTVTSINASSGSNSMTFNSCTAIKTVNLEQDFNCTISFADSPSITNAAEMLTKLKDLTGETSKKITFAKAVYDALTADEIAVATAKNWTVASYG